MPYLVFDLAILAILVFFTWLGSRRGLVLTLCSLLAVFVALIGASFLSDTLAEPVAKAIEPMVTSSIHDTVTSYYQRSPAENTSAEEQDWLAQLPLDELLEPLQNSRLFKGYAQTFQKAVDDGVTEIVTHAVQALAHFVAVQIARIAIFAAAFFALLIAWFFLSRALDLVAHLPILSAVNHWGGGIAGLIKGMLVLFIACWLLRSSLISPDAIRQTVLLKFFCTASPLSFFL